MNLHERVLNVLAMQVVDEVVIGAPWEITQDLITSFNICFVVQGTISKVDEEVKSKRKGSLEYIDARDPYAIPRELGIYREV